MRKFAITVNGVSYEVEVEEIGGAPVYAAAPAPVYAAAPAPVAAPASRSGSGRRPGPPLPPLRFRPPRPLRSRPLPPPPAPRPSRPRCRATSTM